MDKHNGHLERGHRRVRSRVRSSRSPRGIDGPPYRHPGQPVACDADTGWLAVEAA